jgi:hypothetical protein
MPAVWTVAGRSLLSAGTRAGGAIQSLESGGILTI